jgi:hypothetical protein
MSMTLEQAIVTRALAVADLTALVGQKFFPCVVPRDDLLPAVTYQLVKTEFQADTDGVSFKGRTVRLIGWSLSYVGAVAIGEALLAAFENFRDTVTAGAQSGTLVTLAQDYADEVDWIGPETAVRYGRRVDVRAQWQPST